MQLNITGAVLLSGLKIEKDKMKLKKLYKLPLPNKKSYLWSKFFHFSLQKCKKMANFRFPF